MNAKKDISISIYILTFHDGAIKLFGDVLQKVTIHFEMYFH